MGMKSNSWSHNGKVTVIEKSGSSVFEYESSDVSRYKNFAVAVAVTGDNVRPNPHAFTGLHVVATPYQAKRRHENGDYVTWSGMVLKGGLTAIPSDHPSYVSSDELLGRASEQAYEALYESLRGSANLAVDFAERKETRALLANMYEIARRVRLYRRNPNELARDVKRALRGKPREWLPRALSTTANTWMAYRYGIMPLIYSTQDILNTLVFSPFEGSTKVKGRGKATTSVGITVKSGDMVTTIQEQVSVRCQFVGYFKLDGKKKPYDWTSVNPLGIAYELLPLSFVADWALNISGYLSALENHAIYADKFQSGTMTTTYQRKSNSQSTLSEGVGWPKTSGTWGSETRLFSKSRNVLESLPSPDPPSVHLKMNAKRFADAAALIYQGVLSPSARRR